MLASGSVGLALTVQASSLGRLEQALAGAGGYELVGQRCFFAKKTADHSGRLLLG